MSGGWDQALDAQNDLQRAFRTDDGAEYLTMFVASMGDRGKRWDSETGEFTAMDKQDSRRLAVAAMAGVVEGDPVWVNADVQQLVEVAAETFRPEAVYLDDLFIPAAFCLLERPLWITDVNGERLSYRAVSWWTTPEQDGIGIALWSHIGDPDDFPGWGTRTGGSELLLAHVDAFRFGRNDLAKAAVANHNMHAQLQVLWRLAKQEVVTVGSERANRAARRRAAGWRDIKEVAVMTLRKRRAKGYEGEPGESDVEWDHRWMVSGHWRNQPYKINGETVHRQIWIAAYVKGPDDRPLVVKQRAVEFVR